MSALRGEKSGPIRSEVKDCLRQGFLLGKECNSSPLKFVQAITMSNFNSILSRHLDARYNTTKSRFHSTPKPETFPLGQSPTFSNPYKFNQETIQWSSLVTLPGPSQVEGEKRIRVFTWDIGPLFTSTDPGIMSKATNVLKSLIPAPGVIVVLLLRNVPAQLLPLILAHPFIRRTFITSDVNALHWPGLGPGTPAASGTVVLIDRESESLTRDIFRVRTKFGEQGEGGEDVCFVDIKLQGGTVGRVGVLAGELGAEVAEEWVKAEGVRWGVVGVVEGLEGGTGLEKCKHGVFWLRDCEIESGGDVGDAEQVASESGIMMAQFRFNI